jgi:hypothetical protein
VGTKVYFAPYLENKVGFVDTETGVFDTIATGVRGISEWCFDDDERGFDRQSSSVDSKHEPDPEEQMGKVWLGNFTGSRVDNVGVLCLRRDPSQPLT